MRKLVLLLMLSFSFVGSLNLNYATVPIPSCFPCPPPPDDPPPAVTEILLPTAQ